MSYWDTSTLGKLYLPEPDSPAFAQKAANETLIVIAEIDQPQFTALDAWEGRDLLTSAPATTERPTRGGSFVRGLIRWRGSRFAGG
jgi:hypothetical protein